MNRNLLVTIFVAALVFVAIYVFNYNSEIRNLIKNEYSTNFNEEIHLTLQVDITELLKELSGSSDDKAFLTALNRSKQHLYKGESNFFTQFNKNYKEIAPSSSLATIFSNTSNGLSEISSNEEVITFLKRKTQETVVHTFGALKRRMALFERSKPTVTLDAPLHRIKVKLYGTEELAFIKNTLTQPGKLEFFPTIDFSEVKNDLVIANQRLTRAILEQDIDSSDMRFNAGGERIDTFYLANREMIDELTMLNLGPGILTNYLNEPSHTIAAGVSKIKDTAIVNSLLNDQSINDLFNKNIKFIWKSRPRVNYNYQITDEIELFAVNTGNKKHASIGSKITNAQLTKTAASDGTYHILVEMNGQGARIWRRMTANNLNNAIAIVLDNKVISTPFVSSEIKDGHSQISGDFSKQQAINFANILKIGELPTKVELIQESIQK